MRKLAVFSINPNNTTERLVQTLENSSESICLEAVVSSNSELKNILKRNLVSVVVIDSLLFSLEDSKAIKFIRSKYPKLKILAIAKEWKESELIELLQLDVEAVLFKKCSEREIKKAIDALLNNEKFLCGEITNMLIQKAISPEYNWISPNKNIKERLTDREWEIIALIIKGLSSKLIADKLCVSNHTVATHRKNIFRKLKIHNVTELIHLCQGRVS